MQKALSVALLAALGGCHFSAGGVAGTGNEVDAGVPDLSGPRGPDPFPRGAISYFHAPNCPDGWQPYEPARGRTVVPAPAQPDAGAGDPVGEPLVDGEDRHHAHTGSHFQVALAEVSFIGIVGGGNGVGASGTVDVTLSGGSDSSALPYVALLACQKQTDPQPSSKPLPTGLMSYFEGACPNGWSEATALAGRYVVGLPAGGVAGAKFGGPPLDPGELRGHTHDLAGTLATSPKGIALASGCCAGGYAKNGSYPFAGATASASAAPPYLPLVACAAN